VDGVNGYTCSCPSQWTGDSCETDVDECAMRPSVCHNGATCTNSQGSYNCICVNGWTGQDCSVNIDDCAGAACFNGATCIDRVGSFHCQCTHGKTGECFPYLFFVLPIFRRKSDWSGVKSISSAGRGAPTKRTRAITDNGFRSRVINELLSFRVSSNYELPAFPQVFCAIWTTRARPTRVMPTLYATQVR